MKSTLQFYALVAIAAVIGTAAVMYDGNSEKVTCRGGWNFHAYGNWKNAGHVRHTFRADRVLMQRQCIRCGHIDSKESD
jgi:hypothetical protein